MIGCREKMFESDESPQFVFSQEEVEEKAITLLDQLALRIVDGDVDVHNVTTKPGERQMNSYGGVEMKGPKTLEVRYYER